VVWLRFGLAVVVLWALSGCGGQPGRDEIGLAAEELSSIAAQGVLLAGDVAEGETTSAYAGVYGKELSAQADGLAEELRGSEALVRIADQVAADLEALARLPGEGEARRLERELDRAARRAHAIGRLA
jgi:hypothetical protein